MPVARARIGLWDRYGGSMPSGWMRWLLEQYEFPFEVVFPPTLDAGILNARFDVLIFADERSRSGGRGGGRGGSARCGDGAGAVSGADGPHHGGPDRPAAEGVPRRRRHDPRDRPSTTLAAHLGLPITSALVERTRDRRAAAAAGEVLRPRLDAAGRASITSQPLAWGMPAQADVFFDNSPVFRLGPDAASSGVTPIAWFDSATPLRSGWAWGQHYLDGGIAIAEARVGKGKLFLFGPEITFRAQPHGTFKFLFNALTRQP